MSSSAASGPKRYFHSKNKGEISEWITNLNSDKETIRKDAVKKVIAAMTVGKDVSMLFSELIKCVQTNNIELKKLVYLYIMNYAKSQPDLAIMAVNTFVNDSMHANPLIRGLAVRTMGCIRVHKIVEYLAEPLRRTLQDKNPYVRKTAAIAVAKLYDLDPEMAIDQGFVDMLEEMLTDQNPMVVANAVAALSEIASNSNQIQLAYTTKTIKTLLAALGECTEWGQIYILDSLATYQPKSVKEAEMIAERVLPRFQHANSGVVLSAIKVVLKMMTLIEDETTLNTYKSKIHAPLITLTNSEPEIQYVALRNINLVIQKLPSIFTPGDEKIFFCKYNDPIYVKIEKIEIMIKLANEKNINNLLLEFKEYATEIDVEYVRRAVRAIGRCAIKLEGAAQECIDVLLELISTKVNYVVQEAVIVIKDIFRKYPGKYEKIIGTLCENLDTLDEPEAKASMIWILGQYAERIKNADELLEVFLDSFLDEPPMVQLQLLTAIVKLFIKRPDSSASTLVTEVLTLSTERSDNPDLRDRGYVYGRLLSEDAEVAKRVVLSEQPVITDDSTTLAPGLLDELIGHISSLASVYHKPPEMFVPDYNKSAAQIGSSGAEDNEQETPMIMQEGEAAAYESDAGMGSAAPAGGDTLLDLDDFLGGGSTTTTAPSAQTSAPTTTGGSLGFDDFLGGGSSTTTTTGASMQTRTPQKRVIVDANGKGSGLQIEGNLKRDAGKIFYDLTFSNHTNETMTGFAFKFNKNTFALQPGKPLLDSLAPGTSVNAVLPIRQFPDKLQGDKVDNLLQIAIKVNNDVRYGSDRFELSALLQENAKLDPQEFLGIWQSLDREQDSESYQTLQLPSSNADDVIALLQKHNIFYVRDYVNNEENSRLLYFSSSVNYKGEDVTIVAEFELRNGETQAQLCTRCAEVQLIPLFETEVRRIIEG